MIYEQVDHIILVVETVERNRDHNKKGQWDARVSIFDSFNTIKYNATIATMLRANANAIALHKIIRKRC